MVLWEALATTLFSFCRSGEVTAQKESNYDLTVNLFYGDLPVDNAANPSVISIQQYSLTPHAALIVLQP